MLRLRVSRGEKRLWIKKLGIKVRKFIIDVLNYTRAPNLGVCGGTPPPPGSAS